MIKNISWSISKYTLGKDKHVVIYRYTYINYGNFIQIICYIIIIDLMTILFYYKLH